MRTGRPLAHKILSKELIHRLYREEEKSVPEISRQLAIPTNTIRHYMERWGIPQRNAGEAHRIAIKRGIIKGVQLTLSKEELYDLYWKQNYTLGDIAKQVGCCIDRVKRQMQKLNIPRRTVSEAYKLAFIKGRKGNGGRHYDRRGGYVYILQPTHRLTDYRGYVREHVLVWEQAHARELPDGWCVHHINGIRDDNRPENLLGLPKRNHHYALKMQAQQKRIRELESEIRKLKSQTVMSI